MKIPFLDFPLNGRTFDAFKVAEEAHRGQVDRAGEPYILHPVYVANLAYRLTKDQEDWEYYVCAALLHDTVEDTKVTPEDLEERFPKEVTDAVRLLTHNPRQSYLDYVRSIRKSGNSVALMVKFCDLIHNSNLSRLPKVTAGDRKRVEKYKKAKAILAGEM